MHYIVFKAEIEMNSVINSVPEPVPGPKIGSGSEQSETVPYGSASVYGPGKTGTLTCSNEKLKKRSKKSK
jgi:hypothetical protein